MVIEYIYNQKIAKNEDDTSKIRNPGFRYIYPIHHYTLSYYNLIYFHWSTVFFSVSLMEHEPKKRWTAEMWRAQYISTLPLTFQETSLLETRIHLSVDGRSDDLRGFRPLRRKFRERTHYYMCVYSTRYTINTKILHGIVLIYVIIYMCIY